MQDTAPRLTRSRDAPDADTRLRDATDADARLRDATDADARLRNTPEQPALKLVPARTGNGNTASDADARHRDVSDDDIRQPDVPYPPVPSAPYPPDSSPYLARHLALAGRFLDCLERALDDPRELFTAVVRHKSAKSDEEEVYGCERDTIDEKKLQGVVAAFDLLKDIQRQALGILEPKDAERLNVDRAKAGVAAGDGLRSLLAALDRPPEV